MTSAMARRILRWHDILALPVYMVGTFITVIGFLLGWWEPGYIQTVVLMITAWFGGYTFSTLVFIYALQGRERLN